MRGSRSGIGRLEDVSRGRWRTLMEMRIGNGCSGTMTWENGPGEVGHCVCPLRYKKFLSSFTAKCML